MQMPEHCEVCGQPFELQTGFYFGTGYVSYFLSVGFLLLAAAIWYFTIGFSFNDNRVYWFLITTTLFLILTQPLNQRLCRSIWIAFFVRYDKNWSERSIGATAQVQ
jgi:hypothetical protein